MKKLLTALSLILILLYSCNDASKIADELSFLWEIRKDFGGEWLQSYDEGCYKIKITNSDRINENPDSIDYYGVIVGRKYIESVDIKYPCLKLELVDKSNYIVYSQSTSYDAVFDLTLISEYMDVPVDEYLVIKDAIYAIQMADNNQLAKAIEWSKKVDPKDQNNPYVILARAHIYRASDDIQSAMGQINNLLEDKSLDDRFYNQLANFFYSQKDLENSLICFKRAYEKNKTSNQNLQNLGIIYYEIENYDSCKICMTELIKRDQKNLQAYFYRANCYFQTDSIIEGCKDIEMIKSIDSKAEFPDSLLMKCK